MYFFFVYLLLSFFAILSFSSSGNLPVAETSTSISACRADRGWCLFVFVYCSIILIIFSLFFFNAITFSNIYQQHAVKNVVVYPHLLGDTLSRSERFSSRSQLSFVPILALSALPVWLIETRLLYSANGSVFVVQKPEPPALERRMLMYWGGLSAVVFLIILSRRAFP